MNKKYRYKKFIFVMKEKKSLRLRKKIFKKQLLSLNKYFKYIDEHINIWFSLAPLIAWMVMFKILKKYLTKNLTNKK